MPDHDPTSLPPVSAEHRKVCAAQFERANQVIATGNHDYGIQLLMSCCKLDPANLVYRQTLRRTEKIKFKNNLRGSRFAWLTSAKAKSRIRSARRSRDYLRVLEHGEEVLAKNPWDTGAQMDMADAADALGRLDLAIWILEQARQKDPNFPAVNRSLARFYEKLGNFAQAIALWELVRKADPSDIEAVHKAKDLAATETIQRGQYDQVSLASAIHAPDQTPALAPVPEVDPFTQEVTTLQARLKAEPTRPGHYLELATLYRRHQHFDKALALLEEGLAATGNHFQLRLEVVDLEAEPFRQNLALTEEKLTAEPANDELRKIRQKLRKEINSRETDLFRMKADRFPGDLGHQLELGIRLLRGGQIDEAIRVLQIAQADPRFSWRALMNLGQCHKHRGNWPQARRHFEEALPVLPATETGARKEILFALAQGCAEAGELADAVELAHELANLDITYRDIGRLLEDWQARLQRA